MYNYLSKNRLYAVLFIAIVLLLAACGSDDNNDATDNDSDSNTEENTEQTVDSEMGEVTIPANPEKILAPYHEDTLLALGITPTAKWAIGESVQNYLEEDLQDVETIEWTMPLEQVLSYEPDLIILENSFDSYEGTYEDYSAIAPTYVMSQEETSDWQVQLTRFGELLGKEDEAEQAIADYETKVEEANTELEDILEDESVAFMWVVGGQYFLFEENRHAANMVYSELGVEVPQLVKDLGETEATWDPISLEKLSELDADHVVILGLEDDEGIETLNNSNVWQNTKAVQNDQVYHIQDQSNWTNSGIKAYEQTIDELINIFK
ncbi:iron-hydroxamate ABC transporter substrate-binding protein [Oceanobacillus kimchii]|uniref:iron-hydroxamate ABC transporter substrate-binding protein n=1 Tax=Oceanobacillus kimchii TaxID=746691 RepID=UPI0021A7A520|nr:iron-hydroxamate ABC transporter substrate-binding protein [Oceanobacillus kimchii]MCT1577506.1 iron-hydroxamate ABC transporter substrate-binding protein [Oceanobacillus kimchii]MCT2137114.1 iron-hydroxamate ABC transporter substrate-binding protein [Oceanobacillus kimchii]